MPFQPYFHQYEEHLLDCRRCSHDHWLQATPKILVAVLDVLLDAEVASADQEPTGPGVQRYTRANFRFDHQLEFGVETHAAYRGRGFALHAASALVDQCRAAGLEPIP